MQAMIIATYAGQPSSRQCGGRDGAPLRRIANAPSARPAAAISAIESLNGTNANPSTVMPSADVHAPTGITHASSYRRRPSGSSNRVAPNPQTAKNAAAASATPTTAPSAEIPTTPEECAIHTAVAATSSAATGPRKRAISQAGGCPSR